MPNIKKIKINNIVYDIKVETDSALSETSINPIQNNVVTESLKNKAEVNNVYTKTEIDNKIGDVQAVIDNINALVGE